MFERGADGGHIEIMDPQVKSRIYRTARTYLAYHLGMPVLFLILGIVVAMPAALRGQGPPLWFALLWTVLVVAYSADTLRSVVEIRVTSDDSVELRRRTILPTRSIRAVRGYPLSPYGVTIVHAKGKTKILLPVQDLYEFLAWLKQRNPEVKISWL